MCRSAVSESSATNPEIEKPSRITIIKQHSKIRLTETFEIMQLAKDRVHCRVGKD